MAEPLTIWLIHGTWAKNAEWVMPSHALQTGLRRSIRDIKIEAFQWSSWNRFSARRDGARELAVKLQSTPGRHFIIAHSHGGNVAREAIRENEDRIEGLICLNTPFFTVLGRESYYLLNTVIAFIGVTLLWTIFGLWSNYDWHWLATVGLWLVTFSIMGACFASVGGPSWTRSRERYLREQLEPPALRKTRVLCLTTTEDEAYSWLRGCK